MKFCFDSESVKTKCPFSVRAVAEITPSKVTVRRALGNAALMEKYGIATDSLEAAAGRIAEEITSGDISTGAGGDIPLAAASHLEGRLAALRHEFPAA